MSPLKRSITVVVLLALIAVPAVACAALGAGDLAGTALLACVSLLIAAVFVPPRLSLITAVLTAVAATAAMPAAGVPWLAALVMAACGVAMGLAAKAGAASAVVMAPVTVAFVLAEPPAQSAWAVGFAVLASALFGVGVGVLVRRRLPQRDLTPLGPERALAYGGMLTLLAGVGGYFVAALQPGHAGAWLLLTFFVVIQPYLQDGWHKALGRAGGTVLGFLLAMGVGLLTDNRSVLFLVGVLAMIVGIWLRVKNHPYWQNTTVLTVGIVLSEGAATSVVSTAEQRLLATTIGVAASLAAMAALLPMYRRGAAEAGLEHY